MQHRPLRILALTALLAGCATQTDPTKVSDWDICTYTMGGGNNAMVAQAEAQRRNLDCRQLYPAILAQRQQQGQALQDAARMFNPPPPRPMTNCTSFQVGNRVETTCR